MKQFKSVFLAFSCGLILTIGYANASVQSLPGTNYCKDDGVCKGKCVPDVEGGNTCRVQTEDQDCSGTGTS